MTVKERIQDLFSKYSVELEVSEPAEQEQLAEKTLSNGTVVYTDADEFAVGVEVFIVNEEGERLPLPDGEYEYEGGGSTVVAEGVIAEINEPEVVEEPEAPAEEALADDEKKDEEYEEEEEVADEAMEDEEKEEEEVAMSAADIAKLIDTKMQEARDAFDKQLEAKNLEIAAMRQQLSKASKGLTRAPKATQQQAPLNISAMSTQERVQALYHRFANK